MKHVRFLAAKTALAAVLAGSIVITPVQAGIPVIDGTNLSQNIMTAIESVAQTLKQIEQYSTQLQQYQNQLQNTMAPAAYIWDQAQSTINGLMNAVNTLDYYKTQLGSLDSYISKFQDVNYYKGVTVLLGYWLLGRRIGRHEQRAAARQPVAEEGQRCVVQGLGQAAIEPDGRRGDVAASPVGRAGATGQMQAIGYANQLASQQANQLYRFVAC